MDRYQETFDTWNKVAYKYQERFMGLDLYNDSYDQFCDLMSVEQPRILEIGCGPGNITKYVLNKRPNLKISGIDAAPNMVELAKQNNPQATFEVMDARNIHQINTTFDGVLCGFCLPYLTATDCEKLFADVRKLLNTGGVFYLSFVEGDPSNSQFKSGSTGDRCYFYYHRLESIRELLAKSDFTEISLTHVKYQKSTQEEENHTVLIARKNQ